MSMSDVLSAKELLTEVCSTLTRELNGTKLPADASAEIADDSDWHRIRKGYTCYKDAVLLSAESGKWLMAIGHKCGSYPANPYNCDIFLRKISSPGGDAGNTLDVNQILSDNRHFRWSVLIAMADGSLVVRSAALKARLDQLLLDYIAREREVNTELLDISTLGIRQAVVKSTRYKPEFVGILVCEIQEFISAG